MNQPDHDPYDAAPRSLGALLAELRLARGWSQLRIAEQLCAASGVPTVSRHEVSRWERQQRIPGDFWLGWLAAVLEVPVTDLMVAAAAARPLTAGGGAGRGRVEAARAEVDRVEADRVGGDAGPGAAQARQALLASAHAWLTDPTGPLGPTDSAPTGPLGLTTPAPVGPLGPTELSPAGPLRTVEALSGGAPGPELPLDPADLDRLRQLDDLVGGRDLLPSATGQYVVATAHAPTGRLARRALPLVAEAAQLTGWLRGDAGDLTGALHAYRLALIAAATAGDRNLGAHVLGSASHLLCAFGDPRGALLLARTGYLGVRRAGPAGLRALLLHRIALAAALCGRRRPAQAALTAAERAAERRQPPREPAWLYWLDQDELAAMTGRCLVALRRPLRAEPLLSAALTRSGQPRTSAVYGAWLARAWLDLGEVERAAEVADAALLDAVRSGSARAAAELVGTGRRLAAYRIEPAGRRHATLAAAARRYLPTAPGYGV